MIMIKKLFISLAVVLCFSIAVYAKDTYVHSAAVLPKAAQVELSENFKAGVSVVKIDKDFGRISKYEVVLTDGTEITFDSDGNWDSVEVGVNASIPGAYVPAPISEYVNAHMNGAHIVGIDKEHHGYDVELSSGVEMKFDHDGQFLRFDD